MKTVPKLIVCGSALFGAMFLGNTVAEGEPPIQDRIPKLRDPVTYQTEFCSYTDTKPFVKDINWDHPLIKGAEAGVTAVSRSTMSYGDHIRIYELDKKNEWSGVKGLYQYWWDKHDADPDERQRNLDELDAKCARANYENFVKTLLGECRDYPYMVKKKLEILNHHTPANKKGAQGDMVDPNYPFDSLTGDGYSRLRWLMSTVFSERQRKLNPNGMTRFNYNWNETGHVCNRVDNSVKPVTHAEMRYMFDMWLKGDPKSWTNVDDYETGLQKYIEQHCDSSPNGKDLGYSYDFRGHKNFKANWFECNAFIWLSRDAARMALAQLRRTTDDDDPDFKFDPGYYQRPFATRYAKAKMLMGSYLFYPESHHVSMRQASESGGGPHLYVDNQDVKVDDEGKVIKDDDGNPVPGDGLADYRLFADVHGSGDIGLSSQALPKEKVAGGDVTRAGISTFKWWAFKRWRDWGFNYMLRVNDSTRQQLEQGHGSAQVWSASDSNEQATFKLRMARVCVALDRHTNWGPTQMFSPLAYKISKRYALRGAYSPIVAMSYEISKSHSFATGNYPSTHPKDKGKTKFMFIVKFRTPNYYDERNMKKEEKIYWDKAYLNESSLSNDYYHERALDKFGWIPASDISSAAYLAEAEGEDSFWPPAGGAGIIDALGGN